MNCCSNCFSNVYLQSFFSDREKGDCNFCGSKNTSLLSAEVLVVQFKSLLSHYIVDTQNGLNIEEQIQKDFPNQIFNKNNKKQRELLIAIVEKDYNQFEELFTNNVILKIKSDDRHLLEAEQYHSTWEEFKNEIKFNNRFHITKVIDLEKLKSYFERSLSIKISQGEMFYRGRVSNKQGYKREELWNPPNEKAKPGRANPYGISYLYLADQAETAIYETRSTIFDYVTIGEFKVVEDLNIINLQEITYEPIAWAETEELEDYLIYIPFLNTLQKELSLPIRRNDKEIDYLPTQYLSEFIKSLGYDGVKFQSSLFANGFNLALFSPKKVECLSKKIYEIESIKYMYHEFQ